MVHVCVFNPSRSSKSNGVSTTLTLGTSVNLLRVQFPAVIQSWALAPAVTPEMYHYWLAPSWTPCLLITTLWDWWFSKCSVHLTVHLFGLYSINLPMRLLWEIMSKDFNKVETFKISPLCSDSISVVFLQIACPCFHLWYAAFLCLGFVKSSLLMFIHPCIYACIFLFKKEQKGGEGR